MEIHRMKPENPIIIVDEKEFEQIDPDSKKKKLSNLHKKNSCVM